MLRRYAGAGVGAALVLAVLGWAAPAVHAQVMVFDHPENINVLSATNVVITRGAGYDPSILRAETDSYWDGNDNPPGNTNWLSIDFRTSRNIKTIRMAQYNGYRATNMLVSTSTDGVTWTPQSFAWTQSAEVTKMVLNSALDARYLRLDADKIESGTRRWIVRSLRVFGDTGVPVANPDGLIDFISSSAWNGGVTLTLTGVVSSVGTLAAYVDQAVDPLVRQVLWMITTNEGFQVQFDRDFLMSAFNFTFPQGDTASAFKLESSTNGTLFSTIMVHTNISGGLNYYNVPITRTRYLRFTITKTSVDDNRVACLQAFGTTVTTNRPPVPNSQSLGVTFATPTPVTLVAMDPDGDPITYLLATAPAHGRLDGTLPNLTYTPTYGYSGADAFTFRATDGVLTSDVATVTFSITPAGAVSFDYRQNVNVLNASNVVITTGYGPNPSVLRADYSDLGWDTGNNPPGGTNWLSIDFRTNRNVKTIRMRHWGNIGITNGIVATSADGATWNPVAATWTAQGTDGLQISLGNAADTRYLRITGTAFQDTNKRWYLFSVRVFGDTGVLLDGAGDIDLVSGSGFSGGVTLTRNGSVSIVNTEALFVDDAANPIVRNCLYNMGNGEGITVALNQIYVLRQFAIVIQQKAPPTLSFNVDVSSDGASYTNVLAPSGCPLGLSYYSFGPVTGRYVRFTITNGNAGDDDRLSDIQLFGNTVIPPPPPPPRGTMLLSR